MLVVMHERLYTMCDNGIIGMVWSWVVSMCMQGNGREIVSVSLHLAIWHICGISSYIYHAAWHTSFIWRTLNLLGRKENTHSVHI